MTEPFFRAIAVVISAYAVSCFGGFLQQTPPALAEAAAEPQPAIAMHGDPALPGAFDHLPYADPQARKGGRVSIGFLGAFDSLNPFNLKAGSTAQGLNGNVFETLMARSLDEPFTLYGLIAKSIETDPDRTHVTIRLDPRAHFSDGTPITSDDVRFTFELLKAKGRPQQRAAYSLIKSIETPDPLTVHYEIAAAGDREMPLTLALMPVLPRHAVDLAKFDDASLDAPVGSGPYKIADVKPGERLVLKRDPNYWGEGLPVRRGLFNFDEIDIEYFRDANSLFEAFAAGLLDFREETSPVRWVSAYDFPAMRDHRDMRAALPIGGPKGMEGFVFNLRRPLFDDARVREALGLMFDFEWINAHLFSNLYTRTKSFFDESDLSSSGRPASAAERALLAPFPAAVREDGPRWTVTGCLPSKVRVARVIQRVVSPLSVWTRVTWCSVTGAGRWICHHRPAGSLSKIPVCHEVSRLPSTAA